MRKKLSLCERTGRLAIQNAPDRISRAVDGKVVWEGWPNPELKELESLIQKELAKVKRKPKVDASSGRSTADGPRG